MQPTNDLGLLTQALPVARELRDRGHDITFCCPAKAPAKIVSEYGFKNIRPDWPIYLIVSGENRLTNYLKILGSMHLKRDMDILKWYAGHIKENATSEIWNLDHFAYIMGMSNEQYVRAAIKTISAIIVKCRPDVIVNFWNPLMCIAARENKIPLISVIQADLHPHSKGFIWWKEAPANLPTPVPAINKVLLERRLPKINRTEDLSLGDLTLVLGIREIEQIPDSKDITYIGPLLTKNSNKNLPEWIEHLRKDQPVIWVYPGNTQYIKGHDSPFDGLVILETCIMALGNTDIQVVVSTGYQSLPDTVLPLPVNFRFFPFIPGLIMAERSDLVIHHGGYGSCQTCLSAGTPSIIIPTYSERESNARRIAKIGAGDFILPVTDPSGKKKLDAKELYTKIMNILSDPSYRKNARKISEIMKSYDDVKGTTDLIEKFSNNNS